MANQPEQVVLDVFASAILSQQQHERLHLHHHLVMTLLKVEVFDNLELVVLLHLASGRTALLWRVLIRLHLDGKF